MKRIFYVIACAFIVSCSNTPKEKDVKVSNVEITGFIKDYLKVVDGDYKFVVNGDEATITVKFELTAKPTKEYHLINSPYVTLNPIDDKGTVLEIAVYGFDATEISKIEELLKGKIGDTKTVSFKSKYFDLDKDIPKAIFTSSTTFEILDKAFEEGYNSSNESTTSTSTTDAEKSVSNTSTSNDWDAALDEYENYMDDYIKFIKKGKAGDQTAMLDAVELMRKAESVNKRLSEAKDELTIKQIKKLTKIQNKIINAM